MLLATSLAAVQASSTPLAGTNAVSAEAVQPAAPAPTAGLAALLAGVDAGWGQRDEPGKLDEQWAQLEAAAKLAPNDYGVLWRQARHITWLSEDPAISNEKKSELGKRAWELADRATAVNPEAVEGPYFAMTGMGNYSLGIGILSALTQGIEGKFKDRLSRAEKLDPNYQGGGIETAWGRFYFKLPWPKHDAKKSEKFLKAALVKNPDNVRALAYLGDLLLDEDRTDEARTAWEQALAKPPGVYDAPEERRWQSVARASLAGLKKK
jgi:tetratricopeptide (TPR) repeat protein